MDQDAAVQPTIDFREPAGAASLSVLGEARGFARIQVVAGSGVHLSEETRSLLQIRLRAVALTMSLAFGAFFLRDLWISGLFRDPIIRTFHIAVVTAFVASFAALTGRRPISLGRLRALELALFGMTIAFFVTLHYRLVMLRVARGDAVMLMATVKNAVLFAFAMIVLYGMFIPNTWRRAAAVVAAMVAATLLSPLVMWTLHPEIFRSLAPMLNFEVASENILMLSIGAGVTSYAAYIIHTLRVDVFEARRINQYRLGAKIGSGGMGVVYSAEHQLLKRPCAIKLIAPDMAGDPKSLLRFETEVRTTARLSHPNTVEIYDYGQTEDGKFYYVMELLEGLTLADLVDRHGPLPPGRAIFLLRQACGALAEAHSAGLVHRDLKPANIFAARRGNLTDFVKLLDFGLVLPGSLASADPDYEGGIVGSPMYMSPEQAGGVTRPDARADLYGLGAVAYFLLTGRPPFSGPNARAVMRAVISEPMVSPSRLNPGVPSDLEEVILRCLARSPAERYADAMGVDRDLANCRSAAGWDFGTSQEWWRRCGGGTAPEV